MFGNKKSAQTETLTPHPNGMLLEVDEAPKKAGKWIILAIQHVLAMFVACITVPLIVFAGTSVELGGETVSLAAVMIAPTLVSAGIGTIFYLVVTKFKSPVFLASSFAYITAMSAAIKIDAAAGQVNLWILPIGMAMVGAVYCLVALLVKIFGVKWLNKLLPTIVVGPVIMVIGLSLAGSDYCHVINFDPLVSLFVQNGQAHITVQSFLDYPKFLFLAAQSSSVVPLSGSAVGQAALIFIPVSLVTICEHIGDHKNLSGVLQRDLLVDPGLTRTLIGDGVATAISGICCGAANTTYGENVAVVGVTKIASTKVIFLACLFSILLGFFSPLMGLVQTIPACVTGGVSMILYGFIASSGVKMLVNEHIDMSNTKNMFVSSAVLVAGIGGLVFSFVFGDTTVAITSVSVSMIIGIVLNAILREKKPAEQAK